MAVILQNSDAVVGLEHPGIIPVVAVHVEDVRFAVAVEIPHREVHRAIDRGEAGQHLTGSGEIALAVVAE